MRSFYKEETWRRRDVHDASIMWLTLAKRICSPLPLRFEICGSREAFDKDASNQIPKRKFNIAPSHPFFAEIGIRLLWIKL